MSKAKQLQTANAAARGRAGRAGREERTRKYVSTHRSDERCLRDCCDGKVELFALLFSTASFALVAALASALACDRRHTSTDDDATLAQTVSSLRDAPNPEKRPWLVRLESSSCATPAACRLRDVCSKAYRIHDRALESARAARHALRNDAAAAVVQESARLMLEAEGALRQAREATQECATLELRWRRTAN